MRKPFALSLSSSSRWSLKVTASSCIALALSFVLLWLLDTQSAQAQRPNPRGFQNLAGLECARCLQDALPLPAKQNFSLSSTPAWTKDGENAGDLFGNRVTTAGDVNGDGYADVLVGAG